jgi:hypothetical protein
MGWMTQKMGFFDWLALPFAMLVAFGMSTYDWARSKVKKDRPIHGSQ